MARSLFDKLWDAHVVVPESEDAPAILFIDLHLVHEVTSPQAFAVLEERGLKVRRPDLTQATLDHSTPTLPAGADGRLPYATEAAERQVHQLEANCAKHGIDLLGLDDARRGIVHVIGPEMGLTQPGKTIVCGDSHTSTHGAFGALAFGIGTTEVGHVLATQCVLQRKPKSMRITFEGALPPGVGAKDMALAMIAQIGADGGQGYAVEFAGEAVEALSMEGRMTLCNLSIEGGARFGMVAPDAVTLAYVKGRPMAPSGTDWDAAETYWQTLHSDADASFDRDVSFDMAEVAPTVTWGTTPDQALPIGASLPDPARLASTQAEAARDAMDYMGLTPGRPLEGTPVDQVFLGSCTNGRIDDLRAAAAVLKGRKAKVPGQVSPGSMLVKQQAEQEGLDKIFTEAGLEWTGSGCSMCVGMNGDLVGPGKRCASSTNRNFRGRQGKGARTHLMSPAMVAAAAVTGTLTDVRPLLEGRG